MTDKIRGVSQLLGGPTRAAPGQRLW